MIGRIIWQVSKIGSSLSLASVPRVEFMDERARGQWSQMTAVLRELTKSQLSPALTVASSDQFYAALKKNIHASIDASPGDTSLGDVSLSAPIVATPDVSASWASLEESFNSEDGSLDSTWSELSLPLYATIDASSLQR